MSVQSLDGSIICDGLQIKVQAVVVRAG